MRYLRKLLLLTAVFCAISVFASEKPKYKETNNVPVAPVDDIIEHRGKQKRKWAPGQGISYYCVPASDLCYVEYIFGDCGEDAVILYNEDGTIEHFGNSKVKMVGYTHDEDLELDIDPLEMFIIVPSCSN